MERARTLGFWSQFRFWSGRGSALGLSLLAVATAACHGERTDPAPQQAAAGPPKVVEVAEVLRSGTEQEASVAAGVRARQRAALSARISASVAELPFREGERVDRGAVLVRLDDAALRSAVAAAEAAVQAAGADLARVEALLEREAATPRELDQARARAAAARAGLLEAQDNLSYAVLRAPFPGTVAARPVHVGDVVSPGMTLIEIEGGDLEIEAAVGSDLVAAMRPGMKLQVLVDGQTGTLTATIRSVSPAGDPTTHRFEVRVDLPAAPGLRSGLFARVIVPTASDEGRIVVPSRAVFQRGGLTGVFVVADGRARLRWVAKGATSDGRTEIRAGLTPGERVALDPEGLTDGAPVAGSR